MNKLRMMHKRSPSLTGLLFCLVLVACSTTKNLYFQEKEFHHLQRSTELETVPFYSQKKYQCGPAAIATVLSHKGFDIKPEELVREVYLPSRRGSLQIEMRSAIRKRGFVSYPLEPSFVDLVAEINSGNPVIVMQNLGFSWWPIWHYAVVIGYNLNDRKVILRSGTTKRHTTSINRFMRTWKLSNQWAQVIVPPSDIPHTAKPSIWIEAIYEIEQIGQEAIAATGYQKAVDRWPGYRPAWFALGNISYKIGDTNTSYKAFIRTIEIDPYSYDGWNNLAHLLGRKGNKACAQYAAQCAYELKPDAIDVLSTIQKWGDKNNLKGKCLELISCPLMN